MLNFELNFDRLFVVLVACLFVLFCKHPYRNNKECPFISIAVYLFSKMFLRFSFFQMLTFLSFHDLSSLKYLFDNGISLPFPFKS